MDTPKHRIKLSLEKINTTLYLYTNVLLPDTVVLIYNFNHNGISINDRKQLSYLCWILPFTQSLICEKNSCCHPGVNISVLPFTKCNFLLYLFRYFFHENVSNLFYFNCFYFHPYLTNSFHFYSKKIHLVNKNFVSLAPCLVYLLLENMITFFASEKSISKYIYIWKTYLCRQCIFMSCDFLNGGMC